MGDDIDGDAPQGPLVTYCVFCVRLCLIFAEARVPFELVEIDRNCKRAGSGGVPRVHDAGGAGHARREGQR